MNHSAIAEALIQLINSSPRSPRKDEIVALLKSVGVPPSNVAVTGARMGASITVVGPQTLRFDGFITARREGTEASDADISIAVLDFLRASLQAGWLDSTQVQ